MLQAETFDMHSFQTRTGTTFLALTEPHTAEAADLLRTLWVPGPGPRRRHRCCRPRPRRRGCCWRPACLPCLPCPGLPCSLPSTCGVNKLVLRLLGAYWNPKSARELHCSYVLKISVGPPPRPPRRVYELYCDYVLKNPFHEMDQVIKSEQFDQALVASMAAINRRPGWGATAS